MITLPPPFTATRYPGYFWNTETKLLFSLKVGGELREMKRYYPSRWTRWDTPYYLVYHQGRQRGMGLRYLSELKLQDSEIPVTYRENRRVA